MHETQSQNSTEQMQRVSPSESDSWNSDVDETQWIELFQLREAYSIASEAGATRHEPEIATGAEAQMPREPSYEQMRGRISIAISLMTAMIVGHVAEVPGVAGIEGTAGEEVVVANGVTTGEARDSTITAIKSSVDDHA